MNFKRAAFHDDVHTEIQSNVPDSFLDCSKMNNELDKAKAELVLGHYEGAIRIYDGIEQPLQKLVHDYPDKLFQCYLYWYEVYNNRGIAKYMSDKPLDAIREFSAALVYEMIIVFQDADLFCLHTEQQEKVGAHSLTSWYNIQQVLPHWQDQNPYRLFESYAPYFYIIARDFSNLCSEMDGFVCKQIFYKMYAFICQCIKQKHKTDIYEKTKTTFLHYEKQQENNLSARKKMAETARHVFEQDSDICSLHDLIEEIDSKVSEYQSVQSMVEKSMQKDKDLREAQASKIKIAKEKKALSAQLDKAKVDAESSAKEREHVEEENSSLQKQVQKLKHDAEKDRRQRLSESSKRDADISSLKTQLEEARNEAARILQEKNTALHDNIKLREEINLLKEQIRKMERERRPVLSMVASDVQKAPVPSEPKKPAVNQGGPFSRRSIAVVGGSTTWQKKVAKKYPPFHIIGSNDNFDETPVKNAELVIINTNNVGHSCTTKAKNAAPPDTVLLISENNLDTLETKIKNALA